MAVNELAADFDAIRSKVPALRAAGDVSAAIADWLEDELRRDRSGGH